jgi:hypothetical protein
MSVLKLEVLTNEHTMLQLLASVFMFLVPVNEILDAFVSP